MVQDYSLSKDSVKPIEFIIQQTINPEFLISTIQLYNKTLTYYYIGRQDIVQQHVKYYYNHFIGEHFIFNRSILLPFTISDTLSGPKTNFLQQNVDKFNRQQPENKNIIENQFNTSHYQIHLGEIFFHAYDNQTFYRCQNNYVYWYGSCVPICPYNSYNQSGVCQIFCDDNFIPMDGQCILKNQVNQNQFFCDFPFLYNDDYCVKQCPADKILMVENRKCILFQECTFIFGTVCVTNCPLGYIEENKICRQIQKAEINKLYIQNSFLDQSQVLEVVCLNNLFQEHQLCVDKCSHGYFADITLRKCFIKCPYYFNLQQQTCVENCGKTEYKYNLQCVKICPTNTFYNNYSMICQENCYPLIQNDNSCLTSCPNLKFNLNGICVNHCPKSYLTDIFQRNCTRVCPENFVTVNESICIQEIEFYNSLFNESKNQCDKYHFDDLQARQCVIKCPDNLLQYKNFCSKTCYQLFNSSNLCVQECPANKILDQRTSTCVDVCPNFSFKNHNNVCEYLCPDNLFITQNGSCVSKCANFTENTRCVSECSRFTDFKTKTCVFKCSNYGNPETKMCVEQCDSGMYGDPFSRMCVWRCSDGLLQDARVKKCVQKCSDGLFVSGGKCVSYCDKFADFKTGKCVQTCSEIIFAGGCFPSEKVERDEVQIWPAVYIFVLCSLLGISCII
eukprot:EST42092.1 hypothetical protein SS50377_18400 [Spironucleus salmonicida]